MSLLYTLLIIILFVLLIAALLYSIARASDGKISEQKLGPDDKAIKAFLQIGSLLGVPLYHLMRVTYLVILRGYHRLLERHVSREAEKVTREAASAE